MRYSYLILSFAVSLSACSFQSQVIKPPVPEAELTTPPPPPAQTFTLVPAEQATLTATPPPLPIFTFTPTTTTEPLPQNVNPYPIKFGVNGTFQDVLDSIPAGTGKTYSVSALKGQVMSVSVNQSLTRDWVYVPLRIAGADGAVLCAPQENMECQFWRGVLPSTQDYFITLTPVNSLDNFTLRVAINPPGKIAQFFPYLSQSQRASLTYGDEFAPMRFHGAEIYKTNLELSLNYIDTASYLNTNLLEAYFLFGSSRDATVVQTCTQPVSFGGPENIVGDVAINGILFTKNEGGGVAAGNIYQQTYYRAVYDGICYEVVFFVHHGNIGAYPPDSGVREFDSKALMKKFEALLFTLVIN
jgi:hypothetical protein